MEVYTNLLLRLLPLLLDHIFDVRFSFFQRTSDFRFTFFYLSLVRPEVHHRCKEALFKEYEDFKATQNL